MSARHRVSPKIISVGENPSGSQSASLRVTGDYCSDSQVSGSDTVNFSQCFLVKEEEEDDEDEEDEDDDEDEEDEEDYEETGVETSDKEEEQDSEEGKQFQGKQQVCLSGRLGSPFCILFISQCLFVHPFH